MYIILKTRPWVVFSIPAWSQVYLCRYNTAQNQYAIINTAWPCNNISHKTIEYSSHLITIKKLYKESWVKPQLLLTCFVLSRTGSLVYKAQNRPQLITSISHNALTPPTKWNVKPLNKGQLLNEGHIPWLLYSKAPLYDSMHTYSSSLIPHTHTYTSLPSPIIFCIHMYIGDKIAWSFQW